MATVKTYDKYGKVSGTKEVAEVGTAGNPYHDKGERIGTGGYGSSGGGGGSSSSQSSYQNSLTKYQNSLAEQAAKAKQDALRQAWESNSQALNSQKSTVTNNYNSATNKLNAVKDARLPEFQQQRNAASADAAQTSRGVKELMAATGRYNSGFNRSEQLGVDLNRSNAISGITGAQNQFETDVGNQLSDVDAQRVAALNDIAEKLQLGEKQYNDGTLSLTNQLESEKASGALKAFLDAQDRADLLAQQQFDNSYKTDSLNQDVRLRELAQAFNDKKLSLDQEALVWEQQFKEKGFTAEEAFNEAQLKLEREKLAAEIAYKYDALAKSGSSGGSGGSRSSSGSSSSKKSGYGYTPSKTSTMEVISEIDNEINSGTKFEELYALTKNLIKNGTAKLGKLDTNYIENHLKEKERARWNLLKGEGY